MSRTHKFQAFIIGQKEQGEKDRLITLLSKKQGKLVALAKGVRSITSKRSGILQTGNLVKGNLYEKGNWFVLGEAELIWQPEEIRNSLALNAGLLYSCELANRLVPEKQENEPIFNLFGQTVKNLSINKRVEILVIYEVELLENLGFGVSPETIRLVRSKKWPEAQRKLQARLETVLERKLTGMKFFLN